MAVKPRKQPARLAAASVEGFGLEPGFAIKLAQLLSHCRALGLDFRVSQGLRTPQVQAKYYCQWIKRSPQDIDRAADKMEKDGAVWLASMMRERRAIPRIERWQTDALPGAGWHQWGLAADCYCFRNGKLVGDGGDPAYRQYADAAKALGLTAGFYFRKRDSGHVQGPSEAGATNRYNWSEIDKVMKERFSEKPPGV